MGHDRRAPFTHWCTRVLATWMRTNHHLVSLVGLAACFAPLLWISRYNYPSGDDYVPFTQAHSLGTWEATKWWYFNWSGRYAYFFLLSLFPDYDVWLAAYTAIPVVLFLLGFACLFALTRAFLGPQLSAKESFTVATCFYVFLVALTPDITTGFYWMASNILYVGSVFTTLLILALGLALTASTPARRIGLAVSTVLLLGVLTGLNEVSVMIFIGTAGLVSCLQIIHSKRLVGIGSMLLVVSVLLAPLAILAPGNAVRGNLMSGHGDLLTSLVSAIAVTVYVFVGLFGSTPLVLASGLYLVFLDSNRDRMRHLFSSLADIRWSWILVFLLCLFAAISVVLFTVVGVRGLAERVKNVYVYSFVVGWFFVLTVLFVNLSSAGFRFAVPKWGIGLIAVTVAVFLMTGFEVELSAGNEMPGATRLQAAIARIKTRSVYANAYLDLLSGRAAMYARHNEQTTVRFKEAQGACVEFPPVAHAPATIFIPFVKYPYRWCAREFAPLYGTRPP